MSSADERRVAQTPFFGRKVKKFNKSEKEALDKEVRRVISDPAIGQEKKGDLQGVYVHKYRFNRQEMILGYSFDTSEILLITIGGHENYYRDLKNYLH